MKAELDSDRPGAENFAACAELALAGRSQPADAAEKRRLVRTLERLRPAAHAAMQACAAPALLSDGPAFQRTLKTLAA